MTRDEQRFIRSAAIAGYAIAIPLLLPVFGAALIDALIFPNPGAGGPLSAPDVVDAPQSSRQEPAPSGCPGGAGSLFFAEDER